MAACETESVKIDVKAGHSHKLPTDVSTSMIFLEFVEVARCQWQRMAPVRLDETK